MYKMFSEQNQVCATHQQHVADSNNLFSKVTKFSLQECSVFDCRLVNSNNIT